MGNSSTREDVDVRGPSDAPAIVFVHGVAFSRKLWLPQLRALADDYRTVAFDLPGHATRADEPFTMDAALALLDRVVDDHADGRALVVGLSLGGYVAQEFVRRHPDRAAGVVVSGATVNPRGAMDVATRVVASAYRLVSGTRLGRRAFERLVTRFVRAQPITRSDADAIVGAGFYPRPVSEAGFELAGRDFRAALASYPGPTLVANGQWDALSRLAERRHARAAQDATVRVIRGASHTCTLQQPDAYARAVREFARTTPLVT
jgi:pimeloyl-ACP methyl ester carboxylesterase